MHIGVEASCWVNRRGFGRHARCLLTALSETDRENRYSLISDSPFEPPPGMELRLVECSRPATEAASAEGRRSLGDMARMSRALSSSEFDFVLFPSVYSYVPVFSRARKAVFFHDTIAEKYPMLTHPHRLSRWMWQTKVALAMWQSDPVLTVSEYSRRCLASHFKIPLETIGVAGEAPDPGFRRLPDAPAEPDRIIVYTGGFGPHKNIPMLIDVFLRITSEPAFEDWRLVLVGEDRSEVYHSEAPNIKERIAAKGGGARVQWTGFISDSDLVALLNRAYAAVLPSLMEGFGLPAVEAAACGCPSIVTRESPIPELLGEGCLPFDPGSPDDLERALRRVLTSGILRSRMAAKVSAAAMGLSWKMAAVQALEIFKSVASR